MPELDGITLALKVSSDFPDMPILLMTGYAAERQRAHNLDVLIHDVITKPFTLRQICDAAEELPVSAINCGCTHTDPGEMCAQVVPSFTMLKKSGLSLFV